MLCVSIHHLTMLNLVFGAVASAFSVMSKNPIKSITVLVLLTIFIFFGFSTIRSYTVSSGVYEKYFIYMFDVNYHLGNTYDYFVTKSVKMVPFLQYPLGGFSGIYDINREIIDFDQGIMLPSLHKYRTLQR